MNETNDKVLRTVHDQYAAVARSGLSNDSAAVRQVAAAFGYSQEELAALPAESNMGLSCGNPVATASLQAGEVVLDLGCGGGLDVLLAASKVGPTGKAIGIDMTADMLTRARLAAAKVGATNVEFHQATLDSLPLADASVDCIISNCVINLVPDKDKAFREMVRVLRPGGRLSISDIALRKPLPPEVQASITAYVGCIAGAMEMNEYRARLERAGFEAVLISDTGSDLNAYAEAGLTGSTCCGGQAHEATAEPTVSCCSVPAPNQEPLHEQMRQLMQQFDANAYAASVRVYAVKSASAAATHSDALQRRQVQVYDKPMCCSTGVCGPQVDPVLPRFAADLEWLSKQGHAVQRFNLAQQPAEFVQNATVQQLLATEGVECLPVVLVNGVVVSRGRYPSREELAHWTGGEAPESLLPVATSKVGDCCGGNACC